MGTHPIFESDFDCLTDLAQPSRIIQGLKETTYIKQRMSSEDPEPVAGGNQDDATVSSGQEPEQPVSPANIEVEEENESIESAKSTNTSTKSEPAATAATTTTKSKEKSDLVYLTLILVDSGKSHEFRISPKLSVTEITRHVWKNWPETWAEERVERPDILRLIFQGRFLHDDMTLDRVRLPGKKFAMHLLPRERLPDHESHSRRQREKSGARRRGCCTVQ